MKPGGQVLSVWHHISKHKMRVTLPTSEAEMPNPTKRIFLWAVPRSISTAFFRAMMNKSKVKVFLEPYSRSYYYSKERVSKRYETESTQECCEYKDIQATLEGDYPGASAVFVKDMAYYLVNRLGTTEFLPKGYIHTFIVRDPKKTIYSLYKMSLNKELTGWDHFDDSEVGFTELLQMYKLVTEDLKQEAIVVDADDLLQHPEDVMRQYCQKVGIEFEESMLKWDQNPQEMEQFRDWMPWFEGVLTSKTFQPSATKPKSPLVLPELPKYVMDVMDRTMIEYNKLYEHRIRPNSLKL